MNSWKNYFFIISGVGLSPLGTAAPSGLLYKPQMRDEGDCGASGGMKIGRGNQSTRRNNVIFKHPVAFEIVYINN
jgi:hypothetical protein